MTLRQHSLFRLEDTSEPQLAPGSQFNLNLPEIANRRIGLATGVGISRRGAEARARMLSRCANGYNIHVVSEPSYGWIPDLVRAGLNLLGYVSPRPIEGIYRLWVDFFNHCPDPTARFLQICHSKGTLYVRHALERLPPELRKRIDVVSVAGAAYIPAALCNTVHHYVSSRDFVPFFDPEGRKICASSIQLLKPHPNAYPLDHSLYSLTYRPTLQKHLSDYLKFFEN